MVQYRDLEKAVDYLIDETPEGAPLRDGADICRLSDRQRSDRWKKRRRRALPLIVRLCAKGRWKATGKKPGSAVPEHIPDIHFNGSEINVYGDLMATPGPVPARLSRRPGLKVVLWTELRFSVPDSADEGKAAEMPEPTAPAPSAVRPNRAGTRKSWTQARYDYWKNRATEILNESPHFSLRRVAKKIAGEDAPGHLSNDEKVNWKRKGWMTENILRRIKDRPRSPTSTKKIGQMPPD